MDYKELIYKLVSYILGKRMVQSTARTFRVDGEIVADKKHWASFTINNGGTADISLYDGRKLLRPTDGPLNFGPYFNISERVDRIPFTFDPADANPTLEVVFDQYLPNPE